MLRIRSVAALVAITALAVSCSNGSGTERKTRSTGAASSSTPARGGIDTASVRPAVAPRSRTIDATLRTPDGRTRTYHLYVPSTVVPGPTSGAPVPLLVALHGGTGWGTQFERSSGFDGLAEANRFIVVYPDGIGGGPNGTRNRTWNGGACCGIAALTRVDDVTFVKMLVATLRTDYPIDPARVFAIGHSNGGILAYRLACEFSDTIVAIGVQSSALELASCHPPHPVSLIHVHGTADHNLPIDGGTGSQSISGVTFPPAIDGIQTMATGDDCPGKPTTATDAANPDVTIETWKPCAAGTEVQFVEVAGASHAWMGHPTAAAAALGSPYQKLDSSVVIWGFLSAHPRS